MTVAVKICGLSTRETLETALECGADYIGLMFYPPSPRCVSVEEAASLARAVGGRAQLVAVTVDADDSLIDEIAENVAPDFFQAHGSETPERLRQITARTGIPVIKAIKVRSAEDVMQASAFSDHAAMILYDAKAPDDMVDALPGGNGISFDWQLLKQAGVGSNFMLSGGLDLDNVKQAIAVTGAPIIDASSAVETAPGQKDPVRIRKFIETAKSAS